MKIATVGLDLAKTLFQVHGVDSQGHIVVRRQLRRADVLAFFAKLEPCVVGMEACGSSHYWGRELTKLGHTVCLIAPQFVRPYVKSNKTDAADAEAICEAVNRPHMRFVPINAGATDDAFTAPGSSLRCIARMRPSSSAALLPSSRKCSTSNWIKVRNCSQSSCSRLETASMTLCPSSRMPCGRTIPN